MTVQLIAMAVVAVVPGWAYFTPCNGSSAALGASCDIDADCSGIGVVCMLGKCQCDFSYTEMTDHTQYGASLKVCVKVPDTVGATCSGNCRFPLFCDNNICKCIRSKQEGNQCFVDSYLGQSCKRHIECAIPFSACIDRHCACVKGSVRRGNSCYAAAHCPTGGVVGPACTVQENDVDVLHNVINSGAVLDTCKAGQFCFGPASSLTGNCCPLMCPLATKPSLEYSCDVRQGGGITCPQESHVCHRVAGASFSYSICCRKPCLEPKPVYINGNCYARSYLGSPCQIDEQCDGGESMECRNKVCSCRHQYRPEVSSTIPLKCIRSQCPTNNALAEHDCLQKANLGEQCISTLQCPLGAHCFRGLCFCNCNMRRRGNECIVDTPQPRTLVVQNPETDLGGRLLSGIGSSAPAGGFFNVFQNIFKGVRGGGNS